MIVQPRYGHADVFVEADSRDVPAYPASGGFYRLGLTSFHDLDASAQGFRRVDADAEKYVPLFHRNWIVALRGHLAMTQTGANEVPFYLMPTLGGGSTLPGYDDFRFRDRNVASFGAEYRWPVFRMMDAALFADAGTVAPTAGGLLRARLHSDYGLGLRLHTATRPFARLDITRGSEGTRVSVSMSRSLPRLDHKSVPYVP
ncbi:MAG: BamA/TamA family outer membrane protein [Vicinamibacterales bacterium]